MERLKRLLTSTIFCLLSETLMAFSPGNFIEQMENEGYNVSFNNQDTNIAIFIIAILMLVLTRFFTQKRQNSRLILESGSLALLCASALNMLFAVSYFYVLILIILLIFDIHKFNSYRIQYGNIFINLAIYLGCTIFIAISIYIYEYNKCNTECIPPNHYGLKWRPFYEGFTDKAYFERIERKIKESDSTEVLKQLLENEVATVTYDFPILKSKGWEVIDGKCINDNCGYRVFISPAKEIVYVHNYRNDGLYSWVTTPQEYFYDLGNANYYFIPGYLLGLSKDRNVTKMEVCFLNGKDDYGHFPKFISVKDSVLNLPNYDEIDVRNRLAMTDTTTRMPIREELFDFSPMLSFKTCDIKTVSVDQNLVKIQFNDEDSTMRIYAVNVGDLIDKKCDRLIRFNK